MPLTKNLEYGSVSISWGGTDLGELLADTTITIDEETFNLQFNSIGTAMFDMISLGRSARVECQFAEVNESAVDTIWKNVYVDSTVSDATSVDIPNGAGTSKRSLAQELILTPNFNTAADALNIRFFLAAPPSISELVRGLSQTAPTAVFDCFVEETNGQNSLGRVGTLAA